MSEGTIIEGEATEVPEEEVAEAPEAEVTEEQATGETQAASTALKEALVRVESLGKTLGSALQDRGNVVMVRVNDSTLKHLDMLVEADVTKSRSESAAFLINEGMKANQELFDKISSVTEQIIALRAQLRESVNIEPE
jgi:hypothetical protein